EAEYSNLFGRPVESMATEITVWSVNAFTPTSKVKKLEAIKAKPDSKATGTRMLFDAGLGASVDADEYHREEMPAGSTVAGPAVITETETTVVVPTSRVISACADGTLDIHNRGEK
ncbi:MAG: hydantoinase/oxoprolinase family protein, partial [Boseongicola sp.]